MTFRSRRSAATAALGGLALSLLLVPLAATPSYAAPEDAPGTPVVLSSAGNLPHVTDVLRASDGTLHAALGFVTSGKASARVTRRTPGGDWEPAQLLSTAGVSASIPRLALRPDGGVAAVWSEFAGGPGSVWFAERAAGHVWSEPVKIATDGRDARLAVGADGEVVVVWMLSSVPRVASATRPAGGTWSTPAVISGEPGAAEPDVAIDAAGNAVAVYRAMGPVNWVRSVRRPAGGGWSAPFDVSDPTGIGVTRIELLMDPDGRAVALWEQDYDTPDHLDYTGRLATAWLAPGAPAWGETVELSDPAADVRHLSGDVAADGVVTVVWTEPGADGAVVRTVRGSAGTWGEPGSIPAQAGTTSRPDSVTLDVREDGRGAAAWLGVSAEGEMTVEVATSSADGAWQPSRPVATATGLGNARATVTADGDVDAVYSTSVVNAVFVDRTAPVVDVLALPTGAASGTAVDLGVGVTDRWSDTLDVAWDFGDGETGSGTHVQHTYAYGGTYDVTVTVTDESGNTTSSAAGLAVTGPPPPTPADPVPTDPVPTNPVPTNPAPGAPAPVTAPRVRSVHLASARIRAAGGTAKAPRATRLEIRTSGATGATVTITGKRRGLPTVTLTRPVSGDRAHVTLRARIGRRTLPPGRYLVTVVADGAGGASAPVRATLRVIR